MSLEYSISGLDTPTTEGNCVTTYGWWDSSRRDGSPANQTTFEVDRSLRYHVKANLPTGSLFVWLDFNHDTFGFGALRIGECPANIFKAVCRQNLGQVLHWDNCSQHAEPSEQSAAVENLG